MMTVGISSHPFAVNRKRGDREGEIGDEEKREEGGEEEVARRGGREGIGREG